MIDIPAIVTSVWTVLQPFLPVIATKAAEEIGKTSVAELWNTIKQKFDTKETAKEALRDILQHPEDADAQGAFRLQLRKLLEEDHTFVSDVKRLLEKSGNNYQGQLIGSGALAQGPGAKAVGAGGVMIEGDASDNNIVAGSDNEISGEKKKTS